VGKFLKPFVGLSVGKLVRSVSSYIGIVNRVLSTEYCQPKVSLEVKSLVVLLSVSWLHCLFFRDVSRRL